MEILQEIVVHFSFDMIRTFASFSGHTLSVEVQRHRRLKLPKNIGDKDFTSPESLLLLYPAIRSMWGYIVFAFPFVHSFIRTYVRSFVFPSQGQSFCVKVYKTSYFEDPLMDFIHIWHDRR